MTFPIVIDVDGAVGFVQDEAALEGKRREGDLNLLQLLEVALLQGELPLELPARVDR